MLKSFVTIFSTGENIETSVLNLSPFMKHDLKEKYFANIYWNETKYAECIKQHKYWRVPELFSVVEKILEQVYWPYFSET